MTDNKRFEIEDSSIIEGGKVVIDSEQEYTFPSANHRYLLIGYEKALNELSRENKWLKSENKRLETENKRLNKEILYHDDDIRDCLLRYVKMIGDEQYEANCESCIHYRYYYFDEFDSDVWCHKDQPQFALKPVYCEFYQLREKNDGDDV